MLADVGACVGEDREHGGSWVHEGLQELERHHPTYYLYKKGPKLERDIRSEGGRDKIKLNTGFDHRSVCFLFLILT